MQTVLTITGVCAGGNHVFITATVRGKTRQFVALKNELMEEGGIRIETEDQAIVHELRRFAKREGLTTLAALTQNVNELSVEI